MNFIKSFFKNDGNNPLVPLIMVIGMGVVPTVVIGAVALGGLYLVAQAGMALAASIGTPAAIATGTAVGLAFGQASGLNQKLWGKLREKITGKKPAPPPVQEYEPTSEAWQDMVKNLDARKAFKQQAEAPQNKTDAPPPAAPSGPAAPKL